MLARIWGAEVLVGGGGDADVPGERSSIAQAAQTLRHLRVSYSYYKGVPAPITNGGVNSAGVAVRDIWSTSRAELIEMTPNPQRGVNYSDIARIVMERATSARGAVEVAAGLISAHGEATYGGNSHIFADEEEAWVMIQFAGGQGLWVAERLGADDIRASRPGYVLEIPAEAGGGDNFLWSENFIRFAQDKGWWQGGVFDVNTVYGDGLGRWDGVRWIEGEMRKKAGQIGLAEMIWAVRHPKLTGDTAGYGQVVPLRGGRRMLWHAPIGAVAAPFAPVYLDQDTVPAEFGKHRYLTAGEARKVLDMRKAEPAEADMVSSVPQAHAAQRCAVAECKRLLYLMHMAGAPVLQRILPVFEAREATLAGLAGQMEAAVAGAANAEVAAVWGYFSGVELGRGLDMVMALADGLEAELKALGRLPVDGTIRGFEQIW